jgi:cation diffusion facilitator CzcD-associated flavoprotein CzcO
VTRAKLTPDYTIGCKRILLSNDYWPTFAREDVSLVTDPITAVEPDAVVTADGTRHEVDALVLGTGFDITGSFARLDIRGLGGQSLAQAWSRGMHTHLGITVSGFPELYLLLGPNTGLGHNSVVLMIELATGYVMKCLERGRSGAHVVTRGAQAAFTSEMLRKTAHTVWATGCRSWYLDAFGHNTAIWPGSTIAYWWRTRRPDPADFEPVPAGAGTQANPSPGKETIDA